MERSPRKIAFRAWTKENMLHSDEYEKMATFFDAVERNAYPLMQFTGLLDKNGKEVYEGDIVKCSIGCTHRIVWMNSVPSTNIGGMPGFYLSNMRGGYAWSFIPGMPVDEEIVGNIWENPELLKV